MKRKHNLDLAALLFALHFWNIIYLKPIIYIFKDNSTLILLVNSILIFFIYLIGFFIKKISFINVYGVIIIAIQVLLFSVNFSLKSNAYLMIYIYQYASQVVLLILLFSSIKNFKQVLILLCTMSFIAISLYGITPLIYLDLFTDYMDYGFTIAVPAFVGIFISWKISKNRIILFFLLGTFVLLLLFSNRGSILSVLSIYIFYPLLFVKITWNSNFILKLVFSIVLIGGLFLFIKDVILVFYNLTNSLNYNSYAVNRLYSQFILGSDDIFSGRELILQKAFSWIVKYPIFGSGIGGFETVNNYSHNFMVDFLLHGGIIMAIFYISIILYSIFKWAKIKDKHLKYTILFFFSIWFPKLLFSSSYLIEPNFWLFILGSLYYGSNKNITIYKKFKGESFKTN